MSITRTNPVGWSLLQKFKYDEANAIDANIENAVDKREGFSDTIKSTLFLSNPGSLQVMDTTIELDSTSELSLTNGSIANVEGKMVLSTTSELSVRGDFELQSDDVHFSNGVINPEIKQIDAPSVVPNNTGYSLSIIAQSSTGTNSIGGDLVLQSGFGADESRNGKVQMQSGLNTVALSPTGLFADCQVTSTGGFVHGFLTVPFSSTMILDLSKSSMFQIGMLTGDCTIKLIGLKEGQIFQIQTQQDPVGSRNILWKDSVGASLSVEYGKFGTNYDNSSSKIAIHTLQYFAISGFVAVYVLNVNSY